VEAVLLGLIALLAFANGANDNCKGVATLVGYGAAGPRSALIWAAVTTAAGAAVSFWLAGALISSFSGSALFVRAEMLGMMFFMSVLAGAFGWVIFATFTGMPVSTTHAITGALTGAGLVAFGGEQIRWSVLGASFALPLALGPLLAVAVVYLLALPTMWVVSRVATRCLCLLHGAEVVPVAHGSAVLRDVLHRGSVGVVVDETKKCAAQSPAHAIDGQTAANAVHWASSGMIGFARGWNDAPKIAALGLVALPANMGSAFAIVTIAMAIGGLVAGRKVLVTLAHKVTELPLTSSLTASTSSAVLVGLASWNGLPVSTTHVTTGGIVGAGLRRDPRRVHWRTVSGIVLSWVVTLPVAALLAAAVMLLLRE
jgi:inorganic phosphate transporter, PiT family